MLPRALSVLSWRRPAVFPEFLFRAHPEAARARAVDRPAQHSASPAALAQPVQAPRRVVSAAWAALVPRLAVEGALHGAAARPAASGAAEALLPEAGVLRV